MDEAKTSPSESFSVAQRTALGIGLAFAVLLPSLILWILWDRRHKKRKKEKAKQKYTKYRAKQSQQGLMPPKRPLVTMISKPGSVHSPTSERGKPRSLAMDLEVERQDSFADGGTSQIDYDLQVQQEIEQAVDLYKENAVGGESSYLLRPPVARSSAASSEQDTARSPDYRFSFPRPLQIPRSPPTKFDNNG